MLPWLALLFQMIETMLLQLERMLHAAILSDIKAICMKERSAENWFGGYKEAKGTKKHKMIFFEFYSKKYKSLNIGQNLPL